MILRHKLIATEEKISFVKSLQNALPLDQPPSPSIPLNLSDHRKPGFEFKFLQFIFIRFKFLQFTFLQFKCVRFKFLHFNSPTEQSSLAVAGKNRSRVSSTRKERIKWTDSQINTRDTNLRGGKMGWNNTLGWNLVWWVAIHSKEVFLKAHFPINFDTN